MEGYAELLRTFGHTVRTFTVHGAAIVEARGKAARHIFNQSQKGKTIPKDAVFNKCDVDLLDIQVDGRNYSGIIFVPNVERKYVKEGRKTCATDAAHCDGVGPHSYGTTFDVVNYETNMRLLPIMFANLVGVECYEY